MSIDIAHAEGAGDMETVCALFLDYQDAIDVDLCFQGFEEIPASYDNPLDGVVYMEKGLV